MNKTDYVSTYSLDIDNIDDEGEVIRRNAILLNSDVISGAPYFTLTWFLKKTGLMQQPHVHDFDEHIGFAGSDPSDPSKLNGIVKFMIDGEWISLDKSSVLFIPAGVKHCPYVIERVEKPIIHWSAGATGSYRQTRS